MSVTTRIWTCAAYAPAYRCGGWAAVWVGKGQVTGAAGGERHTTASRMALSGLVAALCDLAPAIDPTSCGPIGIQTTSAELAAFAGFLASLDEPTQPVGPDEDLDLWAQIATVVKGRRLSLVRTPLEAGTPIAFTSAWADLALDKARSTGAFANAIPKANLGKIPALDR
jgi:hypothetical protein